MRPVRVGAGVRVDTVGATVDPICCSVHFIAEHSLTRSFARPIQYQNESYESLKQRRKY